MKLYNLSYFFNEGLHSIFTHRFMSFAAMSVITACLILMGSFSLVAVNIENLLSDLENKNEVIAFVDESYTKDQAEALKDKIESIKSVASAEFITRSQALDSFRKEFGEQSNLLDDLDESNPLRDRYKITLKDIHDTNRVAGELSKIKGIAKVSARSDITDKIIRVRDVVTAICLVLIIILIAVSIFIISNTVNLTMFNRREEIAIMKMVGATNWFIRCPFIIEGLLLGICGALIALLLQWAVYAYVAKSILQSVQFVPIVSFGDVLSWLMLTFIGVGVMVGGIGSAITMRKFLKV